MPKEDFDSVIAAVTWEKAMELLGLKMTGKNVRSGELQYRGECPHHKTGKDRAIVVTPGKGWYCWGSGHNGRTVIGLASHIRLCSEPHAARFLMGSPQPEKKKPADSGTSKPEGEKPHQAFDPEGYKQKLNYDHADVQAAAPWLTPEIAEQLAIGFAPSGLHRKRIAFPIRDTKGREVCWISGENLKFPPKISL